MQGTRVTPRRLSYTLLVVIVVLLATIAWFAVSWATTARGDAATTGRARDTALAAGAQAMVNFNTLDYRNADAGLDAWEHSSTGDLRNQIRADREQSKKAIEGAKTVTEGTIVQAGLSNLDEKAGKAQIIAVVESVVTPDQGQPTTKRNRFLGDLALDGTEWKLASLQVVPIGQ